MNVPLFSSVIIILHYCSFYCFFSSKKLQLKACEDIFMQKFEVRWCVTLVFSKLLFAWKASGMKCISKLVFKFQIGFQTREEYNRHETKIECFYLVHLSKFNNVKSFLFDR